MSKSLKMKIMMNAIMNVNHLEDVKYNTLDLQEEAQLLDLVFHLCLEVLALELHQNVQTVTRS